MKKNILIFVHTEYHLLLAINQVISLYSNTDEFNTEIHVRAAGEINRVREDLDFTGLPLTVKFIFADINIRENLGKEKSLLIEDYIHKYPAIFIFFQEQDPLMVILANEFSKRGTDVQLFQDGLKPYVYLRYHSLDIIKNSFDQNRWLRRNGFKSNGLLSLWNSKKYAHLTSISKVFLSFPESYKNWNNKVVKRIEMLEIVTLRNSLSSVFRWNNEFLPINEDIIFYMNQPMHDDGKAEVSLLSKLHVKFPDKRIFIKLHPLTIELDKIKLYRSIPNVKIIESLIPAELFIMHLSNSVILSVNSTSMFINNPSCRFYYLNLIFADEIKRLSRYHLPAPPSPHISMANSIDDICF